MGTGEVGHEQHLNHVGFVGALEGGSVRGGVSDTVKVSCSVQYKEGYGTFQV